MPGTSSWIEKFVMETGIEFNFSITRPLTSLLKLIQSRIAWQSIFLNLCRIKRTYRVTRDKCIRG